MGIFSWVVGKAAKILLNGFFKKNKPMNCMTWRRLFSQDTGLSFSLVEDIIQLSFVPSNGLSLKCWPRAWSWAQALEVEGQSCSIAWFPSNKVANKFKPQSIICAATLWWKLREILNKLLTAYTVLLQPHKSFQILATGKKKNKNYPQLSTEGFL